METNLGDFPRLLLESRQSLGRPRARLQSVPAPRDKRDKAQLATQPGRGEINRRDTEGG